MAGWIKLHRKILDNPIFLKPDLYQLFSYCLLRANHNESKIIWNGEEKILEKGCFITGRKAIAEDTGQNQSAIYKRIKVLEKLNMISVNSNNKYSVVKVLNYGLYQGEGTEKEQPSNNQVTTKEQQGNTDKNVKNVKKVKNSSCQTNKFSDEAIELLLARELYNLILGNDLEAKKPNFQTWAKTFNLMIWRDKANIEAIRNVMKWSQKDSFWHTNILCPNKLRKQFGQLTAKMKAEKQQEDPVNNPKREGVIAW